MMIDNAIALIEGSDANSVEAGIMVSLSNGIMMEVLERMIGRCEELIDGSDMGLLVLVVQCPLFRICVTSESVVLQDGDTRSVASWDATDICDSDALAKEVCRLMHIRIKWRYRDVMK